MSTTPTTNTRTTTTRNAAAMAQQPLMIDLNKVYSSDFFGGQLKSHNVAHSTPSSSNVFELQSPADLPSSSSTKAKTNKTTSSQSSPSTLAKLMKPVYSVIAPPRMRSCYSSDNVSTVSGGSTTTVGQKTSSRSSILNRSKSIRNFWPPKFTGSSNKLDKPLYTGGIVSLIKKSTTGTTTSPKKSSTTNFSPIDITASSIDGDFSRFSTRKNTPPPKQQSQNKRAGPPRFTTTTSSHNLLPKPWTKSSSSQYWNIKHRPIVGGTSPTDFISPSSTSVSTLSPHRHNNERLFDKNVDDDSTILAPVVTLTSPSSSNRTNDERTDLFDDSSNRRTNTQSIILNELSENNLPTSPRRHLQQSSLSPNDVNNVSAVAGGCFVESQVKGPPKFHAFLSPGSSTNEFYNRIITGSSTSIPPPPPWAGNVKTGVVSQRVREKNETNSSSNSTTLLQQQSVVVSEQPLPVVVNRFLPTENERASSVQRVTKLAKQFENGEIDQVGPLKQYHKQVYKRELQKICAQNLGSVLMKAQTFENPSFGSPRLSLPCVGEYPSSLSSVYTSTSSMVEPSPLGRINENFYNTGVFRQSSNYSDSGVAFSNEILLSRKISGPTTTSAVVVGEPGVAGGPNSPSYYPAVVQSTPDVSRTENFVSPKQKRHFGGVPSRHESFLQAVSSSISSPPYAFGNTNAQSSLARILENEPLHTSCSSNYTSSNYQPSYYTPSASSVLFPIEYNRATGSVPHTFAPPVYQSSLPSAGTTPTTTWSTSHASVAATFATPFDQRQNSRKKKAVSFTNEHQPVDVFCSPQSSPTTAFNNLFNSPMSTNFSLAPSSGNSYAIENGVGPLTSSCPTVNEGGLTTSTTTIEENTSTSLNDDKRSYFFRQSSDFSFDVSDEQLQEIDRKTRRGSYIMATTNVGGGSAPVGGGYSPASKRYSNVFTDSTSTTLSFSTGDYANDDDDQNAGEATKNQVAVDDQLSSSFQAAKLFLNSPSFDNQRKSRSSTIAVDGDATTAVANKQQAPRMQRIINFFSGDQTWNKQINEVENQPLGVCSTSPSTSRGIISSNNNNIVTENNGDFFISSSPLSPRNLRRPTRHQNSTTSPPAFTTTSSLKLKPEEITRQGPLIHKQTMAPDGRKSTERVWKNCYAILHDCVLYLCKDRPNFNVDDEIVKLPEDALTIDVKCCIADIAYDYIKRKNVFRITTQRQTEHLLQAEDSESMLKWLENFQQCNSLENNPTGLSNSMALIIKRYEAQSQSVSPSVKPRRPAFLKGSSKDSALPPPSANDDVTSGVDGASSSSFSSQGEKMIDKQQEKGDTTPGKARKWRKVRKSGSCPVPSPRGKEGLNPDSMFGQMLEDCPTSGETDFVPLIVQLCVKVVEHHGLTTVGVYRIPGNTAAVNSLTASLDKGFENTDFNDPRWRDVNVVSSLLKAFLRKLPDPLLTDKLYMQFIDANRLPVHSQRLKKLRQLIEKLPKSNYETLKYLLVHLRKIVAHSHINKMEARNLALMFGPSLVRPSGESMTTMVTHMSDQCKIIESLILYCDYFFACDNNSGDVPPGPLPMEYSKEDFANTSFADMNDLLRRVSKTEEELEKTKDTIVKSIWKVRRGSRKNIKAVNGFIGEEQQSDTSSPSLSNGHTIKEPQQQQQQDDASVVRRLSFNERNIDEEIVRRQSIDETTPPLNYESNSTVTPAAVTTSSTTEFCQVAEEMRRRREENIYTARRIFIAGTDAQTTLYSTPSTSATSTTNVTTTTSSNLPTAADVDTKMDLLAQHSRHLNVNNLQSLDVLSPETREKIRRFQFDSQMLRYKSQRQAEELTKVENERMKIEQQCEQAKQDVENDDFLDALADNPRFLTNNNNANPDSTSITSDYSTTSSNFAGSDQQPPTTTTIVNNSNNNNNSTNRLMSQSFTGALPCSDYSSNASPITPHNTNLNLQNNSTQSLTISQPQPPPSPQLLYDRQRLKHLAPDKTFLTKTPFSTNSPSNDDVSKTNGVGGNSSTSSIPYALRQRSSPPTKVVARSKTSNVLLFGGRRSKAWYETDDDEFADEASGGVDASFIVHLRQHSVDETTSKTPPPTSTDRKFSQQEKFRSSRIVSIDEETPSVSQDPAAAVATAEESSAGEFRSSTASRISQKIKFRSKSSSADKRKDNRRHTLGNFADMEAIKTAIFGSFGSSASSKDQSNTQPTKTPDQPPSKPVVSTADRPSPQQNGNSNHKQSRTDKFKAWFKESFRRSSPDLIEDENLVQEHR